MLPISIDNTSLQSLKELISEKMACCIYIFVTCNLMEMTVSELCKRETQKKRREHRIYRTLITNKSRMHEDDKISQIFHGG